MEWKLWEDMFNFKRQVQIATDDARRTLYLLAGKDHVKFEDNETTFTQLQERIVRTKEYIAKLTPDDFEGFESRQVSFFWMKDSYVLGKDSV